MALLVEKPVLRNFFSILVVYVSAMVYALDDQSGFISIDCGSSQGSNYTQHGISYISDEHGFIEGGESHDILSIYEDFRSPVYNTLRSFPENKRNCYTLRPLKGKNNRYLIRAVFFHGKYDGTSQSPQFDLYIGADYWVTVNIKDPAKAEAREIIHLTSSDYIYVCLLNTGNGNPFISALELRLLNITMYEEKSSLILMNRYNFGSDEIVRYEDDKYDRIWYPLKSTSMCCRAVQASDTVSLKPLGAEEMPLKVMRTAITPINSQEFQFNSGYYNTTDEFIIYLHLAEIEILESNQKREFNIIVNNIWVETVSPSTSITSIRNEFGSLKRLTLQETSNSTLPPIINALEMYTLKQFLQNQTHDQDAAAIWSTKSTYGLVKLNWQGDPCVPQAWVGLKCSYSAQGAARIISMNLSSRGLSGEIATALANLTMIESLDLSYNNLTGNVLEFLAQLENLRILNLTGNNFTRPLPAQLLAKSKKGSLWLSIEESSSGSCLEGSCRNKTRKIVSILAHSIGGIVVLFIIIVVIIVCIVKQLKKKVFINKEEDVTLRKRKFTYSEVESITKKFQNEIGRGGFGSVFHGFLGDNQVAVKMLSESSSQGYKEFQTEVKFLMKLHHKNITSLVGYCDDSNHKGIIYDFMDNGNLEKHLFDGCPNVLSWERRLQIGCDVAEGLEYMHHGCRPPIVHRDVKPSNILLNERFQAKLADFGLSRAFLTEDATHVTATKNGGTLGYTDPEYRSTYRLRDKSDVYSFGVLLLELITSRRAISKAIHITEWVKEEVEEGQVEKIIDSRLEGRFDINTARKVVELANACVSCPFTKRPTMNDVVTDLKHCLKQVKSRQTN